MLKPVTKKRSYSFADLCKKQRESGRFHEFLRTALDTGFFAFDTVMFTQLSLEERRAVHKIARRVPQLHDFNPLQLLQAVPARLGVEVCTAEPAAIGDLDEYSFLRLRGGDFTAFVQTRHFLTLMKRHPKSVIHFAKLKAERSPITFLEDGKTVALIMPVKPGED